MTAYTLLWTRTTWNESATRVRSGTPYYIDYVAAEDRRPFNDIVAGDEIFVLAVIGGNLYIGGRLIAKSSPVTQMEAASSLGRSDLVEKNLYVLAKPDNRDIFRASKLVDLEDAKNLELITSKGVNKKPDLDNKNRGMISENTFRPQYKLSPKSATILRNYLDLPKETAAITQPVDRTEFDDDKISSSECDTGEPEESERKRTPISPEEDEARRRKQAENGALGEALAKQYEIARLGKLSCPNPDACVDHVALRDIGAGYDICSVWNGETRYIEVKAEESKVDSFFISSNEVETLTELKERGWIYLVDLSKKDDLLNCVTTISNAGEKLAPEGVLKPTQFRATLRG